MIRRCNLLMAYVFNRLSMWILLVIMLSSSLIIFMTSGIENGATYQDLYRDEGFNQWLIACISTLKITFLMVSTYLIIQGYYPSFCRYHVYFIQTKEDKTRLFFAKLMALTVIEMGLLFHWITVFFVTACFLTPYTFDTLVVIRIFLHVGLFGWMTLLLGITVIQLIPTLFSSFIPFVFYFLLESQSQLEKQNRHPIFNYLFKIIPFPTWSETGWKMEVSLPLVAIIIGLLWGINGVIFLRKDVK